MPFHHKHEVKYYTFEALEQQPLTHAVFTRRGGVSHAPWGSLNMGMSVGDARDNVQQNKQRAFEAIERDLSGFADSWLVHSKDVFIYDQPDPPDFDNQTKADIILTDNPAVSLFMRYADCVPLLFYDPEHHAIGLAHSGWKGTVLKVGQAAVKAMQARYGSDPAKMIAAIGPSISAERYEVGEDVIREVQAAFGKDAAVVLPRFNDSVHFDLWRANQLTLEQIGVGTVELAGLCTATHPEDWYSHRGEGGNTGRFGVLIGLHA
jgi:hypothetical protein